MHNMRKTRMQRLRLRQLKELAKEYVIHISIALALAAFCIWLSTIDNNRPWTYQECTYTYRYYSPDYIARECNHLRNK